MGSTPPRRSRGRPALLAVLGVAMAVRLVGLGWGLPYLDLHPDEPLLLERAEHLQWSHPNPHFYIYPTFFIYQEAAMLGAASLVGGDVSSGLLATRALTAVWSLVTVLALYGLGSRVGSRRLGLLAAGLYAVNGASVLHAHYAVTDTPMAALATVTLWLAVRAWQERSATGVILAAATAGLAVSTKYSAASVVYVPLVTAFALAARARWSLVRSGLFSVAVPVIALLAFLATSPYVLLDHQTFFRDLRVESELQATARSGLHVEPLTDVGWRHLALVENLGALFRDLGPLGLAVASLALGSVLVAFFRRDFAAPGAAAEHQPVPSLQGPRLIGWAIVAAWPVLFFLQMAPSTIGGQRYMLPIYPALLLLAAAGINQAAGWLAGDGRRLPLAALLAVLVVAPPLWETGRVVSLLSRTDTRLQAREWVLQHLSPGSVVAREHYAPPLHSSDGFRVLRPFSLTTQSFEAYCERGVEYLLLSSRNAERYLVDDTDRFVDQRHWYRRLEDRTRLLRRFEGAEYGFHHPTIEIRRLFCPDAAS